MIKSPAIRSLLLTLFFASTIATEHAAVASAETSGIDLVPVSSVFRGISAAETVTLTAYELSRNSDIVHLLIDAADRGAHVNVGLDADTVGAAGAENDFLASHLELHHINVHRLPMSHMKVAVIDGIIYLSDRNWPASSTEQIVVRDVDPSDRRVIEEAIVGSHLGATNHLWTEKSSALQAEAAVINSRTSDEIDVESESFGAGTPVYEAMVYRADGGDRVKLLIAQREFAASAVEQRAVDMLHRHHIDVRLTHADEKMAIEGYNVFFGSANATRGLETQADFGIALRDSTIATQLHAQFEREWRESTALPAQRPQKIKRDIARHAS
jgi:hypothetical protein